ncbi:MAG: PIN domain-containing protein [Deltaproteobacteria bacterium]|nr:PIN domain-containing protein [Deltaproteobacteria bacterium]
MSVLVDTSIWIEYFRNGKNSEKLDFFIDENLIVINDLILAELVPSLKVQNQRKIIDLLNNINKLDLSINWDQIMEFQFQCLKNGLNGIGIPDLIIAQNAKQNHCNIYTLDSHFKLMKDILKLQLAE